MKIRLTLIIFCLGLVTALSSQPIQEDRFLDWSGSGNLAYQSVSNFEVDIHHFKNEQISWNQAFNLASDAVKSKGGGVIFFPKGDYPFSSTLSLTNGVVIRGEGSKNTHFTFNLGGSGHCIQALGNDQKEEYSIQQVGARNEFWFATDQSTAIKKGDWIRIIQNDSSFIYSSWSRNWIGQICQVTEISNNKVRINNPLSLQYSTSQNLRFRKLNVVQNVGIEDVEIIREDKTSNQTSNILFSYAVNSWIGGVASKNCNFSHITLAKSANNLVTGCHFKDAFSYGGGGKAYGVTLQFASTQNRITNNVFDHLRHSMLLQACSNGNVFGYNYSINPYWTGVFAPEKTAGDIVLHGNYVYSNLFEGNIAQNLVIDDSHGMNGPYNTFFRNRLEYAGIFMNPGQPSDGQNFIANEMTHEGKDYYLSVPFKLGMYAIAGKDHYEAGNIQHGTVIGTAIKNLPASLYLQSSPSFWKATTYPALGESSSFNTHSIPSEARLNERKLKTLRFRVPNSTKNTAFIEVNAISNQSKGIIAAQILHESTEGTLRLERSDNLKQFHTISELNCRANIGGLSEYIIIDENPEKGTFYYRLVREDDFTAMVSDTLILTFGELDDVVTRVDGNVLSIDLVNSEKQWDSITVYGLNGQILHAQKITNHLTISLPQLRVKGMVIIELTNQNHQQKVIKQLLH